MPEKGPLPDFLRRVTWVDFRSGLDDADAFHRLVSGIKGIAPGPAVPSPDKPSHLLMQTSVPILVLKPSRKKTPGFSSAVPRSPSGWEKDFGTVAFWR